MITRVYAFGRDKYWLDAINNVKLDNVILETVHCSECLSDCLDDLPNPDPDALVLIDIFSPRETIDNVLRNLRNRGWRNIVVIAADPSVKESRDVFLERQGSDYRDYRNKTYDVSMIKSMIEKSLRDLRKVKSSY
ncbi:MAG TPA: hypothetical protein VK206_02420 [Anaerolineales bacterium]|nr:hypothetical protein [Anaerolineales bacterium]